MKREPVMTIATRLREQWAKLAERIYGDETESETARGEFISPFITAPPSRNERKRL
jgi:hypothetical protein